MAMASGPRRLWSAHAAGEPSGRIAFSRSMTDTTTGRIETSQARREPSAEDHEPEPCRNVVSPSVGSLQLGLSVADVSRNGT